jgi:two-component system, LuxR family, sensor histidine kinase DctS
MATVQSPAGNRDNPAWRRAQRTLPPQLWAWWLLPIVTVALLIGTAIWLTLDDREKAEETQRRIAADALSLEAQLREQVSAHERELKRIAAEMASTDAFLPVAQREFAQSISQIRSWLTLYLIDQNNVVLAEYPPAFRPSPYYAHGGISAHVETVGPPQSTGGVTRLVARFPLRQLLEQGVPWWVASRYSVRFIDDFDQLLASTDQLEDDIEHAKYKISFDPPVAGVQVELVARDRFRPWWSRLPLFLLSIAPLSLVGSTWLLARQTRSLREAERAWRAEVNWRRAMEDSITIGMRVLSTNGTLIYTNPRFAQMTGFSESELIGCTSPMPYWASDSIDETRLRLQRVLEGDSPKNGYEVRWQRKDGTPLYVMVLETPLIDATGTQLGWMASAVDISERKQQEAADRAREEQMIAHARLVTIGEIASTLAHELNQPLSAIVSYNSGLKNQLASMENINASVSNALLQQGVEAKRAGDIVARIRRFLSRTSPQMERCDLSAVARNAYELVHKSLKHTTASKLELDITKTSVFVQADRVLLEQVVVNLIRNADESLSANCAHLAGGLIRVRVGSEDQHGIIVIDDAGPGFGDLLLSQISAPFFSTKANGMGLGLAICRSILEAHRGKFEATSKVSVADGGLGGARFQIRIPLSQPERDGGTLGA